MLVISSITFSFNIISVVISSLLILDLINNSPKSWTYKVPSLDVANSIFSANVNLLKYVMKFAIKQIFAPIIQDNPVFRQHVFVNFLTF